MAGPAVTITARDILDALELHYRKPGTDRDGEILIPEVQAPGSQRRADLVRIGMWASRGTGIDVHEVKVSRSDWLRELDDPAKAEAWWPFCNRFWITAPPGVVADGELPAGWGLLELPASGRRFKTRVRPAARTDVRLTVPLMVELLRRADNRRIGEIMAIRQQHRDEMYRLGCDWRAKQEKEGMSPATRGRLERLDQLEAALGMRLSEYPDFRHRYGQRIEQITPAELAAFLADARDHVTLQHREANLERNRRTLHDVAARVVKATEDTDGQAI